LPHKPSMGDGPASAWNGAIARKALCIGE
jgi:hypothetical protein